MLGCLAAAPAFATPVREEPTLFAETGVYTAQSGVGVGVSASAGTGLVRFGVDGRAIGRIPTFETPISERSGLGLVTTSLDVGGDAGARFVVLLDGAVLDPLEQDCTRRFGCRSQFFVRPGPEAPVGVSLQPAAGLRLVGRERPSGVWWSALLGVQPTRFYEETLWALPRAEVAVASVEHGWSAFAWASRYGLSFGVGVSPTAPRRR